MKQRKEEEREEREQWSSKGFGVKSGSQASSLRDKYMDKINRLKEKKKQESASKTTGMDEVVGATTSAGLSTWVVNDGANEVLVRWLLREWTKEEATGRVQFLPEGGRRGVVHCVKVVAVKRRTTNQLVVHSDGGPIRHVLAEGRASQVPGPEADPSHLRRVRLEAGRRFGTRSTRTHHQGRQGGGDTRVPLHARRQGHPEPHGALPLDAPKRVPAPRRGLQRRVLPRQDQNGLHRVLTPQKPPSNPIL
ncbi:hypothetical protein ON010_g19077 [Phytophthora cinnamomi]|nr:hypothetical protein ON010_g19077 [Phytophthora cinnamomi]